jgi:hypothetical protein
MSCADAASQKRDDRTGKSTLPEGSVVQSTEALEEIERIQNEFGVCKLQIPDPVERWWYTVDRVEFDAEAQAIRLISDH